MVQSEVITSGKAVEDRSLNGVYQVDPFLVSRIHEDGVIASGFKEYRSGRGKHGVVTP